VLRIGFFPDFKGGNAVLVSADSEGIQLLRGAISQITASPASAVPAHAIARVSQKHPTSLFVTAELLRWNSWNLSGVRRQATNTSISYRLLQP
jgi:hypothetical protein